MIVTDTSSLDELAKLIGLGSVLMLTGAGISTESGIPDYRGPLGSLRKRQPMQYRTFVSNAEARKRYWARSAVGWPRIAEARPNAGHTALADLEALGLTAGLITQNVDGLHQAAGSTEVLELHGSLGRVCCLECKRCEPRSDVQQRLLSLNRAWQQGGFEVAPDGDAEISQESMKSFVVPACGNCGGVLKPDVVFFGESVPRGRVEKAWSLFDNASSLLVAGSSLTVFSGYRFVQKASKVGKPVAVINRGPTRGDSVTQIRVDGALGEILPILVKRL